MKNKLKEFKIQHLKFKRLEQLSLSMFFFRKPIYIQPKLILFLTSFAAPFIGKAQQVSSEPKMADDFRSNGKIYIVIGVLGIIFTCIIIYLIYLDIKIKRLENKK